MALHDKEFGHRVAKNNQIITGNRNCPFPRVLFAESNSNVRLTTLQGSYFYRNRSTSDRKHWPCHRLRLPKHRKLLPRYSWQFPVGRRQFPVGRSEFPSRKFASAKRKNTSAKRKTPTRAGQSTSAAQPSVTASRQSKFAEWQAAPTKGRGSFERLFYFYQYVKERGGAVV
jgi:hypothetical protein